MNPRLIDIPTGVDGIGSLVLPSYFTLLTIGFVLATLLARRWFGRHGLKKGLAIDLGIWMALWGVIGSRILHVLADGHLMDYWNICFDPSQVDWKVDQRECVALKGVWDTAEGLCHPVESNCWAFANVTAGGFAFYGGFIAAALFGAWFIRRHKLPAGKVVDMAGWAIMLGMAWGRMGCFLASCCFGARTDSIIGVIFPGRSAASRHHWDIGLLDSYRHESLPVHPTQLYEAVAGLAIAAFAYFWLRPRKRFDGQVFVVASSMYAVARFSLEFIRRDERGAFLGLSTSQLVALGMIVVCAWLWGRFRRAADARLTG